MLYMPFGLSEPSLVPIPPAKRSAATFPFLIASAPTAVNFSLFSSMFLMETASSNGVITPLSPLCSLLLIKSITIG